MAICWKCQGNKKISRLDGSGDTVEMWCPECNGNGWIGSPPVEVPKAPPETILPPCDKPPELKTEEKEKGKGKPNHFFLASELYEKCLFCAGTQKTTRPAMIDGAKRPDGTTYSGPLSTGSPCICVNSPTPGFSPVGLTVGQVERFRAERDALLTQAVRIHDGIVERDSSAPKADAEFGLAMILDWLADVLAKCSPGEVKQVRYALSQTERKPRVAKPEGAD